MGMRFNLSFIWIKIVGLALVLLLISAFIKPKDKEITLSKLDSIGIGSSIHLRVGTEGLPGAYQQLEDMNVNWVREEIPWREVEQIPGQYQWYYANGNTQRDFHFMLDEAEQHNLEVVAVLSTGPAYLPHVYPDQSVDVDLLVENWKDYVQAVVDRFGDQIDYWEISPQANRPETWGKVMFPTNLDATSETNPFLFARMLTTAEKVIKKHNSRDTVILGGLYSSPANTCETTPIMFLSEVKKAGAWKHFDVIAVNPYWENNPPEAWMPRGSEVDVETMSCDSGSTQNANLVDEIRMIRDFANQNGKKPIWITEIGWKEEWLAYPAAQHAITQDQVEANYVVRSIIPLISEEGVEKIFWYSLYEDPENPGFVLGADGQQALKNIGRLLGGARSLGQFQQLSSYATPQDLGIYEFRFRKEGRMVIYAWTASGGESPYPVTFEDLPGKNYRAYAASAQALSVDNGMELSVSSDQSLTIYVNEFPVILIQQNPNLITSLSHRLDDGMNKLVSNQKSRVDSWVNTQISKLGEKALDWAEEKIYNLLNQSFDKIEENLSLGNN
jgi:hypothetical protein